MTDQERRDIVEKAADWMSRKAPRYVRMNSEMIWMSADMTEDFRRYMYGDDYGKGSPFDNDEQLARKALAYIHKERQEKLAEERKNAKTCRNCKYAILQRRIGTITPNTCQCSLKTHGKYNQWYKQMRLNQSCELFERIKEGVK